MIPTTPQYQRGYDAAKRAIARDLTARRFWDAAVSATHHRDVAQASLDQDEWTQGWIASCEAVLDDGRLHPATP